MASRGKSLQKFGTQVEAPKKVMIYKGGDRHDQGKQFLVKQVRTLDQFERRVAQDIGFLPTIRGLYTLDGKRIKDLDEIEDKSILIAVRTGETFRRDRLPAALQSAAPSQEE